MNLNDIKITRKEFNIIAKNRGIEDLNKISTNDLMNTLSVKLHYVKYINNVTDDRIKG